MGIPLMAAASPMISRKRSVIRRGPSCCMTVAVVTREREKPDAESPKTSSREASMMPSSTSGPNRSMASAISTAGEKKRCLERIPSSGSSRQATQETGAAIAAAAWSAPRHQKHAKCPSPGAREAGQEAHRSPEKDLALGALSGGPEKGRLSAASPEPLPPAWEIRVEVLIFLIVVLNFSLISTSAERKGRMSDGIHRVI